MTNKTIMAIVAGIGGISALAFAMHKRNSKTDENSANNTTQNKKPHATSSLFSDEIEQHAKEMMKESMKKRKDLIKQIDNIEEKLDVISAFRYELYRDLRLLWSSSPEETKIINKDIEDKLLIAYKSDFDKYGIKDGSKEEYYELSAELDSLKKELSKLPF